MNSPSPERSVSKKLEVAKEEEPHSVEDDYQFALQLSQEFNSPNPSPAKNRNGSSESQEEEDWQMALKLQERDAKGND